MIGPGDQGILFEHRERHRPSDDRYRATAYRVLEAVEKIKQS